MWVVRCAEAIMVAWVLCVVALCASGVFADSANRVEKLDIKTLQERQKDVLELFYHVPEPNFLKKFQDIASTWTLEKNIDQFRNTTAASQYAIMIHNKWIMPRNVPYTPYEPTHNIETITAFNVLYSAKTYDAFYKAAVYLRGIINEGLFVYAVSVAILNRADTQGLTLPPIYETFPNYFVSADVLYSAQRINAQGKELVAQYPNTYEKDGQVVVKGDATLWALGGSKLNDVSYFTHDHALNAYYYYKSLEYPTWLSSNVVSGLNKDRRGEYWWYNLKQIVARYYMERLSNGLGEIPALGNEIEEGYNPNLLNVNGVPVSSRPDYFSLSQNKFADKLEEAKEFERRIWVAIDKGFYVTPSGEKKTLWKEDGADLLGLLIQANADSPNSYFYKDFLRLYASIVGNTAYNSAELAHSFAPLVVPSAIQNYQTALRDPAYYIVLKRILNLFTHWNKIMKYYTPEELSVSGVKIEGVETDKLVTFMEKTQFSLINVLPMNANERKEQKDETIVSAEYTRLNHKKFNVKVRVTSPAAKSVLVKFFLAPKYDSKGNLIDVRHQIDNFFQIEEFVYELKSGENVITRESTANEWTVKDWLSGSELYKQATEGKWVPNASQFITKFPDNLILPKGSVNGMTFQLAVFIDENKPSAPRSYDPAISLGLGSGERYPSSKPMGYPMNRPLYAWQIMRVPNIYFQDVVIYHEA